MGAKSRLTPMDMRHLSSMWAGKPFSNILNYYTALRKKLDAIGKTWKELSESEVASAVDQVTRGFMMQHAIYSAKTAEDNERILRKINETLSYSVERLPIYGRARVKAEFKRKNTIRKIWFPNASGWEEFDCSRTSLDCKVNTGNDNSVNIGFMCDRYVCGIATFRGDLGGSGNDFQITLLDNDERKVYVAKFKCGSEVAYGVESVSPSAYLATPGMQSVYNAFNKVKKAADSAGKPLSGDEFDCSEVAESVIKHAKAGQTLTFSAMKGLTAQTYTEPRFAKAPAIVTPSGSGEYVYHTVVVVDGHVLDYLLGDSFIPLKQYVRQVNAANSGKAMEFYYG